MADNNLSAPAEPVDTTPSTYDEQVEDISNLLNDPEDPDPAPEEQDPEAADVDPDDPDAIDAEDADDPDDDAEGDGPPEAEFKGGRFAADDAKVTLDNGKVISVKDLKVFAETREKELQRGTTEKFQALAAKQTEVDQQAQSLSQSLEYLNWYSEHYLPKAPAPFNGTATTDPMGYMTYMQQKEAYDQERGLRAYFEQQTQALSQQKQKEAADAQETRVRAEVDQLRAKDPLFRDKTKALAWLDRAKASGTEFYGFTPQEIEGVLTDHRMVLALRDALRYRAIKAKAPAVREEVGKKPVLANGGKRADPKTKVSRERQARSERLRREGSIDAGAASLMDLDL